MDKKSEIDSMVLREKKQTKLQHSTISVSFQIINGKYVEGFYIYARQLDSDNDTYKMLTVLNGGGASTCTVNGLLKYQSYEFFIVPFYKTVEGKPSNSRIARTLEDGKFSWFFVLCCFILIWIALHAIFCARNMKKQ